MEPEVKEDFTKYSPSDPELIDKIVNTIKSKGIFDQFRKDCLADVDTKPAYQNLQRRVNGSVNGFLNSQKWPCAQNKTQLRESVRKHTVKQSFLEAGVDRIVDQVVMPKIYSIFHPKVEEIVYELLGLEKPKPKPKQPKPLLDLQLDFQNFKKSLEASITKEKDPVRDCVESSPVPSSGHTEEPQGPAVKEEEEEEEESQSNHLDAPHTPPPLETNGDAVSDLPPDVDASSAASEKSALEVLNNDDDSNTIDEMPLLAASMDTSSNRATTPVLSTAKNGTSPKVESFSDSDSNSLPSSRPPMELDSSTNNLSSLKSDCKVSPTKKFDNFSNLGEKLKQSDVNLRETTSVKAEEVTEESSEVTKSSEHDSDSIDLDTEVHSDTNTSAVDNSRHAAVSNEILVSSNLSDDSMSSSKSKSKSQDSKKDDKIHNHKQIGENESKNTSPEQATEVEKEAERPEPDTEGGKKEHAKSSSKCNDSISQRSESSRDKSKSHRHRDDKHRSKDGHSSERNGKHDPGKESDEKKTDVDKEKRSSKHKNDDSDKKKKKEEKSRHSSKGERDSKSSKKEDRHAKGEDKEKDKFKTPEKEKKGDEKSRGDRHRTKSESGSRSSRSKSGDDRHNDSKKHREDDKNDKKDDDKKKDSRKRKSGKCDENDSKSKNSRRSSDRDSNGNAGGGSDKSKPAGSSQTAKKSSKSEQKTRSRYKDPSNSDAAENESPLPVADEVDLILLQINNSIENEQHRLDVREILSDSSVTQAVKPKIARNFHEIRKIMEARKSIGRSVRIDAAVGSSSDNELEILPSKDETTPGYEKDLSSADSSACDDDDDDDNDDDGEISYGSLGKTELKDLTVVVTDVMRTFSNRALNSEWDFRSNNGVSVFLGSDDEIVRVEECNASENHSDDKCCSESLTPAEEVPPYTSNTGSSTPRNAKQSAASCEEAMSQKMTMKSSREDKASTNITVLEMCDGESVPLIPYTGPPKSNTKDVADDDQHSIKSDRSDSSRLSQKDSADSTKLEEVSKRYSADSKKLPVRSTKRKNAGTRMYAILEEVSSSKHCNAPAGQGSKRKTSTPRSNSDTEKHSESDSQKEVLEKGEHSSVAESSRPKDAADDGSDVSNKENDEAGASGTGRSKNQKADQSVTVETRSTRRRNPGQDKSDESRTDVVKNSGIKNRVSLSSKSHASNSEAVSEGDASENPRVDFAVRHHTRRSASSLGSKVRDSDEEWLLKAKTAGSSKASDSTRKSLECLQMEKENLTSLITTSQSSELNSLQTVAPSSRRKSCPDILHPRDHCENKDPDLDRDISVSEGVRGSEEMCSDARKTEDSVRSKTAAVRLSNPKDVPQKQFEYRTRNVNNRKKSICSDKRNQKKGSNNENDKSVLMEVVTKTEEPHYSGKSTDSEKATEMFGGDSENRESYVKSSECSHDCPERGDDISVSSLMPTYGSVEPSEVTNTDSAITIKTPAEDNKCGTEIETLMSSDENRETPSDSTSSDDPTRKSTRISKRKFPSSKPEEELPNSEDVNKGWSVSRKQKTGALDETESKLKENKKHLNEPVCKPNLSNLSERPKREIRRPSWRSDLPSPVGTMTAGIKSNSSKVHVPKPARVNTLAAESLTEDSASSSSLEFRGFSEENAEPDSDVDCLGFSDVEIQKAAAQLRLLTVFIASCRNTVVKTDETISRPGDKYMDVSSNAKELAFQSISKPARKRKLSLPSSPDKDKKDALIGQCKAESKDSGLCESPEQTSFAPSVVHKSVSVDPRTPVNGTRTKPARTPFSRVERSSKTETFAKTDSVKTRNSQRYCASDLYKPRPSFARDVRAVKRTASPESSTPGRAKKRSR